MRNKIIAGNWKMNMLPNEAMQFINELAQTAEKTKNEIILCVPYTDLFYSLLTAQETQIKIGAQNMHWEESGAYTGEISAEMLKCINVEYVLIGHSERRQYFNETDESVNLKIKAALKHDLKPIVCVGETLEQREDGKTEEVVCTQIEKAFKDVDKKDLERVIIAYEPVWAIGTGKTATAEDANNTIICIRNKIKELYKTDDVDILYGGSIKPENAKELFEMSDIDGGLIGGASLKIDDFISIVDFDKNA